MTRKKKASERRSVQICLRIDLATKQQLSQIADADMRSLHSLIYKIVKEYLIHHDQTEAVRR